MNTQSYSERDLGFIYYFNIQNANSMVHFFRGVVKFRILCKYFQMYAYEEILFTVYKKKRSGRAAELNIRNLAYYRFEYRINNKFCI